MKYRIKWLLIALIFLLTSFGRADLGDWKVVGVADIINDNKPDIVFQNTKGQIGVWNMEGSVVTKSYILCARELDDWRIVGIADMNGVSVGARL